MKRRLPPAERRRQIVGAARTAIAQRGLATTSLRDIAAAADVSMGTVTYHFASVDEILSAVVIAESEQFYGEAIRQADAEPHALRAMELIIEPMFRDGSDVQAHWRIWSEYWAVVARRPEIAQAYAIRIRSWEACCERTVARGIQDGTFVEIDPQTAALKLAAYSDGLGAQLAQGYSGLTTLTAPTAQRWMMEFVEMLLRR